MFERQAHWCDRLGSPFTARLMEHAAIDAEAGGIVAGLTSDWSAAPQQDAVGLRLAGALHAGVLTGRDADLAAVYPKRGRAWDFGDVWPIAKAFLEREADWVRAFMQSPPQTNEVGRAGGLAAAFLWLAERMPQPFRMIELGASAGLNLNWDRFRYAHEPWWRRSGAGPLIPTVFEGTPPEWREIAFSERLACDQAPIDVRDADQALRLRSYVWPDQFDRMERLDAAVAVARDAGAVVERADAGDWLAERLAGQLPEGTTVIYHSVFFQYPPQAVRDAITNCIETSGADASAQRQLAWVRFEPEVVLGGPAGSGRFVIDVRLWDGAREQRVELGEADPHGRSAVWRGAD